MAADPFAISGGSLDPADWPSARAQSHRMLDDILDYIENIRERPVWRPIPDDVREHFRTAVPSRPTDLAAVHNEFMRDILPFATGNVHPGFMGWVHGGGSVPGMLAEMLAAGLNANLGGRDHMPIEVERQIVQWLRQLFEFPVTASGLFVTGTSMANLLGVLIARTRVLGVDVRRNGVASAGKRLVAYASAAAHGCISQAMDLSGLGSAALHVIPLNDLHQIDIDALKAVIAQDRDAGLTPFLVVGTAGSVDTGAIDDLAALAAIARREQLWFHVDGAIGALAIMAPDIAPRLAGIQQADSVALDFHKWGQVPYDAGFILVRDGTLHRDTFRFAGGLSAARNARARGRRAVALRFRARSVARLSRAQDLVHVEGIRHRRARRNDIAHLRTRSLPRGQDRHRARVGAAGAGFAQHRLFPLSRRSCRPAECENCRRSTRIRHRGTVNHGHRQSPRDPRGDRQPPYRAARHRCLDQGDIEIRRRRGHQLCRLSRRNA